MPGFRRRRRGRGFSYEDAEGATIRDQAVIARIKALAIPPAWSDVWICPLPNGHLQATGRDARGRKQYRYHARWRDRRDIDKFERIVAFGRALPRLRARCRRDLARVGLPREKVLAAVVSLLGSSLIRIGNDAYARVNRSFGLTTMKDRHAAVAGSTIRFRFRGKGGHQQEVDVVDRRLARVVRRCQDLPGQELFQYVDPEGEVRDVGSEDVNTYIREAIGDDFTAKDFRTWAGTMQAYRALSETASPGDDRPPKRRIAAAVREAANSLANTPAVARSAYVHPSIIEAFTDGSLGDPMAAATGTSVHRRRRSTAAEERAVVALLEHHGRAQARESR